MIFRPFNWLRQLFDWPQKLIERADASPDVATTDDIRRASLSVAPVVWLLGRTGSGKTSIIASLTGESSAEIGNGYAACTKTAMVYDFPMGEPFVRFLDTRGLGEAGYDPTEDMSINTARAHLVIATMRASDMNQHELVSALQRIRKEHQRWPIIVVQTCLHELYGPKGANHPLEYTFSGSSSGEWPSVPRPLRAALECQRSMLDSLKGDQPKFVPIDFTLPEDGFTPTNYGREALVAAVLDAAPQAVKELARVYFEHEVREPLDALNAATHKTTLYYAAAAAGVGAVPVVGAFTVPAANIAMLRALANRYDIAWNRASLASLIGMLGIAAVAREGIMFGLRQLLKAVPLAIPVAAVQDYAVTYALGRAACVFMAARRANVEVKAEEVKKAFVRGLKDAFRMSRTRSAP